MRAIRAKPRLRRNGLMPAMTRVGQPVAEAVLTERLLDAALSLIKRPPQTSLVCIEDAELGTGRPDLLIMALEMDDLRERRRICQRIPNLAHARVLGAAHAGTRAPYSDGHVRKLTCRLVDMGWVDDEGAVRETASLITSSLVVEAKVSDWRKGIGQLLRYQWSAHQAALLIPRKIAHRVPPQMLRHNSLGLIATDCGATEFVVDAPEVPLSWVAQQWVAELAIRSLDEDGLLVLDE